MGGDVDGGLAGILKDKRGAHINRSGGRREKKLKKTQIIHKVENQSLEIQSDTNEKRVEGLGGGGVEYNGHLFRQTKMAKEDKKRVQSEDGVFEELTRGKRTILLYGSRAMN